MSYGTNGYYVTDSSTGHMKWQYTQDPNLSEGQRNCTLLVVRGAFMAFLSGMGVLGVFASDRDIVKSCGLALNASFHFSKLPVVFCSLLHHL